MKCSQNCKLTCYKPNETATYLFTDWFHDLTVAPNEKQAVFLFLIIKISRVSFITQPSMPVRENLFRLILLPVLVVSNLCRLHFESVILQ